MQKSGQCPKCNSLKVIRYTSRYVNDSGLVRYVCAECGFRETHVADVKKLIEDDVVSWEWARPQHEGAYR